LEEGEPPPVVLDIVGDDLGILIGRRGETLAALQYITRLMVSRKTRRWYPLVVDVEQYKLRRERSLRRLAQRMAERVSFSRQPIALEAMSAYERRIVHMALRDHPSVTTESVGEGDQRKVTIIPKT
jgi:spoIIIJ-associated protein